MNRKTKIAVITGAGVSAESGISTFRDSNGLWENYNVEDVASIEGWYRNRELMLDFYNQRRAELARVQPNAAHRSIAELEQDYEVTVITQNIDNLHERAGDGVKSMLSYPRFSEDMKYPSPILFWIGL